MLFRLVLFGLFWGLAAIVVYSVQSVTQYFVARSSLRAVTYNVLAPCWVSEKDHAKESLPFLNPEFRREQIVRLLKSLNPEPDLIALQETTEREFRELQKALAPKYLSFQANHDPHYWSAWIKPDTPWEPNGVALFAHRDRFSDYRFRELPLSDTGNHAVYFRGTHRITRKAIRAFSVHLDADTAQKRQKELSYLLHRYPRSHRYGDLILGDFNDETGGSELNTLLQRSRYLDVLAFLELERWTHPFWEGGYSTASEGILDHIAVRGLKPVGGRVLDQDLWNRFPAGTGQEDNRAAAALQEVGSDHFPVLGELLL